MTINYVQTNEIIPSIIKGNKEVFLNEILANKETLKNFIESETYERACEKLGVQSEFDLTLSLIDEEKIDFGSLRYVEFFDNYVENNDAKAIVFALFKGNLRYFVITNNEIKEINIEGNNTYVLNEFEAYDKSLVIEYIIDHLNLVTVEVEVSNRHVHLTKEDLEALFGKGYELEFDRPLSQTGQFAAKEKVTIKTEKGEIENVRVLGPVRKYTQVEISRTDSYKLKINPPVRDSGDVENSAPITIVGPLGEIAKESNCIIADRHIHATEADLLKYNLDPNKLYKVKVYGEKGGIFDNVHVKVDPSFVFKMHLDTDDANAFMLKGGEKLEIIEK